LLTLDPDNALGEASKQNNSYIFVVDVPSTATPSRSGDLEFYAREAHFHAMMPNAMYDFHFEVRNTTAADIRKTKWRLQIPDLNIDNTYDLAPIASGAVVQASRSIQIIQPGLHAATVTIDAAGQVREANE